MPGRSVQRARGRPRRPARCSATPVSPRPAQPCRARGARPAVIRTGQPHSLPAVHPGRSRPPSGVTGTVNLLAGDALMSREDRNARRRRTVQRPAEQNPGSPAVVVDENRRHEQSHDRDPAATPGGLINGSAPTAVIQNLEEDASRLGPERQLDGVVPGRLRVGMFDAVAHRLVDGAARCRRPLRRAVRVRSSAAPQPDPRQMVGVRRPDPMNELRRPRPWHRSFWLGHVIPRKPMRGCRARHRGPGQRCDGVIPTGGCGQPSVFHNHRWLPAPSRGRPHTRVQRVGGRLVNACTSDGQQLERGV